MFDSYRDSNFATILWNDFTTANVPGKLSTTNLFYGLLVMLENIM